MMIARMRNARNYFGLWTAFDVLAGKGIEASTDGEVISGTCADIKFLLPADTRDAFRRFLNLNLEQGDEVIRFAKRYGPLFTKVKKPTVFRETIADWKKKQFTLQAWWDDRSMFDGWTSKKRDVVLQVHPNYATALVLTLADMFEILLDATPKDLLGRCENVDCKTPRFIKQRSREKYCGPKCSEAAVRRQKSDWWNKNRSVQARTK